MENFNDRIYNMENIKQTTKKRKLNWTENKNFMLIYAKNVLRSSNSRIRQKPKYNRKNEYMTSRCQENSNEEILNTALRPS